MLFARVREQFAGTRRLFDETVFEQARDHRGARADAELREDAAQVRADCPRAYVEHGRDSLVRITGRDLHSGNFGGSILNPVQALCRLVASLQDRDGRVLVPCFYERVRRWPERERAYMRRVGPTDAEILRNAGVARGWGERGFTLYERTTVRPSLGVTGIKGGKSIVPARASAKIDIRLVPDQRPEEIERLFRRHVCRVAPRGLKVNVSSNFRTNPALVDRSHPAMRAAVNAYQKGFGVAPVFVRSGGSIPVVNEF